MAPAWRNRSARSSYRCLRLGVDPGLCRHTWIDGQRCELPLARPSSRWSPNSARSASVRSAVTPQVAFTAT